MPRGTRRLVKARIARWAAISAGYVGAVVGAGFASGREIAHFFARHGGRGLLGAALAGLLFAWMGAAVVRRLSASGGSHYGQLLHEVCGERVGGLLDRAMSVFLLVTITTVLAGARAVGTAVGMPGWITAAMLAGTLAIMDPGGPVHARMSLALVPLIGASAAFVAIRALRSPLPWSVLLRDAGAGAGVPWYLAAILYVGYNLVMALAGLCAVRPSAEERSAPWAAAVGGGFLGLLCTGLTLAMTRPGARVAAVDLPLMAVLPAGQLVEWVYVLGLMAALWTTGTAAMTAFTQRLEARGAGLAAVVAAFLVSMLGLHWLVAFAYPVMGYMGMPLLIALAIDSFRPIRSPPQRRLG